jgi:hypothetical protein
MSEELENLKAENAKLEDRIAKLEKAAKPPEPFVREPMPTIDYTAGMSMPLAALREMVKAIPESVMRGLRSDAQKPNPVTMGPNPQPQTQPVQRGSGWRDEVPISSPPGIELCDRLVDAQDKIDRAELAMKLAKAEMLKE